MCNVNLSLIFALGSGVLLKIEGGGHTLQLTSQFETPKAVRGG